MFKVTINDYVKHDPRRDRNGGAYAFFEQATVAEDGTIEDGEYSTTAEFPYCPACGTFNIGNCCDGVYQPSRDMERVAALAAGGKSDEEVNAELWPRNKKLFCDVEVL
jgi:hypothetical protein